ncbi:MAG: phosphoglycerate mutase (2,3-diphosphoglycerate-independent), partial [Candidatus Cloacimonetes bacterium]|nr:phosphoglycerate mutase (2,3-diphosphoglycerate-independent) [Candidatus Cloacimonadota bacterium]
VIFFNFRADRARQLTSAFVDPDFAQFPVKEFSNLKFICFSEYDETLNPLVDICFRLPELKNILGETVSAAGMRQLRLAETEKYAHVTFFFNGGREKPYPDEDRILVPSPKVATYDLQPEMSAYLIRDKLIQALHEQKYEMIVTNFANCDMVGHSGDFSATVKAVETVDRCLEEIIPAAIKNDYAIILTADHGNADKMLDESGNIFTAHSKNPVPFLLFTARKTQLRTQGILADIAPTILELLNLNQPAEMTGKSMMKEI